MKILALDLGTHTGWALFNGNRVESGVQVFDVKRGESPGMRYLRLNNWLNEIDLLTEGGLDLVVYEQCHMRGGAATEVAAGFSTRVQAFCAGDDIEHSAVHSATLKKFATGHGNAGKPDMIAAARLKLGFKGDDDNEADALWLLEYARKELVSAWWWLKEHAGK